MKGSQEAACISGREKKPSPADRTELLGAVDQYRVVRRNRCRELGPSRVPGPTAAAADPHPHGFARQCVGELLQQGRFAAAFGADNRCASSEALEASLEILESAAVLSKR
jgi:hypothetical protein